ncbi:nicotinate-nucleotide adenylyltransferase [Algibacter mikhailovii]|uniref:nicotinate-nucleotide adenylyltransferase n=1 Tax=Algibacter mikhailovii TaxID=425498 RepID=UPI002494E36D|nr:nicotinate-nucleotide adenylyltransferase [Algibacter mikhailovii]
MKILLITLLACFTAPLFFAQTIELSETLITLNYKYLDKNEVNNPAQRVKDLESELLKFNHKEELSDLYDDKYDTYSVSFHVPKGKIIAAYDKDGKIVRTIEKYDNVRLPLVVMQSVSKRFPNWGIVEDIYLVKYHCDQDSLKQEYKIKIQNDDETITVRTDENGVFL